MTDAQRLIHALKRNGKLPAPRMIGPSGMLYGWYLEFCPDQSFIICPRDQEHDPLAWQADHYPTIYHRQEIEHARLAYWATRPYDKPLPCIEGWNPTPEEVDREHARRESL